MGEKCGTYTNHGRNEKFICYIILVGKLDGGKELWKPRPEAQW
jgi:hypothetical protein